MARHGSEPPDPRVQALFSEPPERFVAARDALARDLSASRPAVAAYVKALRRPTRRLWILNRLSRARPEEIAALLDAGGRLRAAHAAALQGRRDSGLREADDDVSRRLDALVVTAAALLQAAGHPPQHALLVALRSDLRATLAAGGDDAERLRTGTLDHVPRPEGLTAGILLGAPVAVAGATGRGDRAARVRSGGPTANAGRHHQARAQRERDRAGKALAAARAETARRNAALTEAEAHAAALRERAEAARRAQDAAREALSRAEKTLADASAPDPEHRES